MSKYNLAALDDKEFEAMAVDLIGTEIGKRIERFKPGVDGGVDGRWFVAEGKEAVIQCKHWIRSGYGALAKHMVQKEKLKIERLKPARYILVTSVPLSRHNKQSLSKQLAPYVVAENDIMGGEDIEDLLQRHPEVEHRHYKLWLTSASALQHVFNNAIAGRSQFDMEQIWRKMPLIVKTNDFAKAEELLSKRHVVIITGAPGIGKTTLAEQLIVESLSRGFELVSIEQDISEAEAVFAKGKKQVFFFDDFLGRNILEALEVKYDSHIIRFINRVRYDETKRFVLTSRSNILNQARRLTDLFDIEKVDKNEYEVRIEALSRLDKAMILYSHIWHSDISDDVLNELFKDKRYKIVAEHKNFNPRLISFITDSERVGVLPQDYWSYVTQTLKNPRDIWKHFFSSQLDQDCRDLVYLVVLNGRSVGSDALMNAFRQTHPADVGKEGELEHRTAVAVRICVGAVLNRKINGSSGQVEYSLYNPSIADYVFNAVADWVPYHRYFAALRSVGSLAALVQMNHARIISNKAFNRIVDKVAELESNRSPYDIDSYAIALTNIVIGNTELRSRYEEYVRKVVNGLQYDECYGYEVEVMELVTNGLRHGLIDDAVGKVSEVIELVDEWPLGVDEFSLLSELIAASPYTSRDQLRRAANRCVKKYWVENVVEYVNEADLLTEVYAEEHYEEASYELAVSIATAVRECGFDLDEGEIAEIAESVDLGDIVDRNIRRSMHDDYSSGPAEPLPRQLEDQLIDDLFERDSL